MPERKGRKRRPNRERRAAADFETRPHAGEAFEDGTAVPVRGETRGASSPDASIPALRVRYFAFIVAVLTLMLGVLTLAQGITGTYGTADAALRIGAGVLLLVVAMVIGVLALVPARVAAWLRRG